jgi:hypothetical protein
MDIGNLAAQVFFMAAGVAAGVRLADDIWAWRESRKPAPTN